jgi:hypothetical protein
MPEICDVGRLVLFVGADIEVRFVPHKDFLELANAPDGFAYKADGLLEAACVMMAAYKECLLDDGIVKPMTSGPYNIKGERIP